MNPENTIFDAKRLIGRDYNDNILQADLKHLPFDVKDDNKEMKDSGKFDPTVETDDLAKEDEEIIESDPDAEEVDVAVEEVKE